MASIYKLLGKDEWRAAKDADAFGGSEVDHADGFIHFSSAGQLAETARRHFAGRCDLVCLEVDPEVLGEALKWEPSRGGDLFPHLYGRLPLSSVRRAWSIPLADDGAPTVELAEP